MKPVLRLSAIVSAFFGTMFVVLTPVSAALAAPKMSLPADMTQARVMDVYSFSHVGIDIAPLVKGTYLPVLAAADGEVVRATFCGRPGSHCSDYGNMVEIKHANGYETRYAHLDRIDVKVGDHVLVGQPIGIMGNTGRAIKLKGPYLHFETMRVSQGSNIGVRLNPQKVLPPMYFSTVRAPK